MSRSAALRVAILCLASAGPLGAQAPGTDDARLEMDVEANAAREKLAGGERPSKSERATFVAGVFVVAGVLLTAALAGRLRRRRDS